MRRKTLHSPRHLTFSPKRKSKVAWTPKEDCSLVQFIALHKDLQPTDNEWPCMKPNHPYWLNAAKFIADNVTGSCERQCEYYSIKVILFVFV